MAPAQRGKRAKRVEDGCGYRFRIEGLLPHYSFGQGSRFQPTAHDEYLHPNFDAVCLEPPRLKDRVTRFTLIGDRTLERDLWEQEPAPVSEHGIGTLTMRGERSEFLGSIPYDAVWRLTPMIALHAFRFVHLHGAVLSHGSARIRWIGFYHKLDKE